MIVVAFAGCQPAGLSEEEVRSIVREEVTAQLANVGDIVAAEVIDQLASLDELTVSKLHIMDGDGNIVATFGGAAGGAYLNLLNLDGAVVASLGSSGLFFFDDEGDMISTFGTRKFETGAIAGDLLLLSPDSERAAWLGCMKGGSGVLWLLNESKQPVVQAGVWSSGDGDLSILDKYGEVTFVAPVE